MAWSYPVFLDLTGRKALVVGGRFVAPVKTRDLLAAGALVTVLAPEAAPEVEELAAAGVVERIRRDYHPGDLAGFYLVISTHLDPLRNEPLWREARERNILFNAIDDRAHADFAFPAIHRQGDLTIAVSTNGKAPALAVRVREQLASLYGADYAALVEAMGELRAEVAAAIPEFEARRAFWHAAVAAAVPPTAADPLDVLRRLLEEEAKGAPA